MVTPPRYLPVGQIICASSKARRSARCNFHVKNFVNDLQLTLRGFF
jgi:hypothetical protein